MLEYLDAPFILCIFGNFTQTLSCRREFTKDKTKIKFVYRIKYSKKIKSKKRLKCTQSDLVLKLFFFLAFYRCNEFYSNKFTTNARCLSPLPCFKTGAPVSSLSVKVIDVVQKKKRKEGGSNTRTPIKRRAAQSLLRTQVDVIKVQCLESLSKQAA